MELKNRIRSIIAEECFLKPELITDDALFQDLGVDSLAQIQIWMRVGQELEVEIPDSDSDFWANNSFVCLEGMTAVVERIRAMRGAEESAAGAAA